MTHRPRVLFLPEFFPSELVYSAFAERCRALAQTVGTSGFDVTTLVLRKTDPSQPLAPSDAYAVVRRRRWAERFFLANFPMNMLQRFEAFLEILRATSRVQPHVIVVSAHDPMFYGAAILVATIFGIPVVADAHDSRLVLGALRGPSLGRLAKVLLEQSTMARASRIWVPTGSLADLLSRTYRLPRSRISIVGNGMDASRFANSPPYDSGSHALIHLGSPREYYDTGVLIKAFVRVRSAIPDATLTFLGVMKDKYTFEIEKLSASSGLSSAVRFLPPVRLDQVPRFLKDAAVGIHTYADHPAYAATVGLKVMEYMAIGLPIVHCGPRGGETWRLVERNGVGLCADTADGLADALTSLLESPGLREKISSRALSCASRYDWHTTLQPGIEDLRGLVN